jgi:hypothetical protein
VLHSKLAGVCITRERRASFCSYPLILGVCTRVSALGLTQVYCNNASCKTLVATVFGNDLAEREELVGAVDRWISILKSEGVSNALR